jgi:hypothetical protein
MSRREVIGAVAKTAATGALVPVLQTAPDARGASLAALAQRAGIVKIRKGWNATSLRSYR